MHNNINSKLFLKNFNTTRSSETQSNLRIQNDPLFIQKRVKYLHITYHIKYTLFQIHENSDLHIIYIQMKHIESDSISAFYPGHNYVCPNPGEDSLLIFRLRRRISPKVNNTHFHSPGRFELWPSAKSELVARKNLIHFFPPAEKNRKMRKKRKALISGRARVISQASTR